MVNLRNLTFPSISGKEKTGKKYYFVIGLFQNFELIKKLTGRVSKSDWN